MNVALRTLLLQAAFQLYVDLNENLQHAAITTTTTAKTRMKTTAAAAAATADKIIALKVVFLKLQRWFASYFYSSHSVHRRNSRNFTKAKTTKYGRAYRHSYTFNNIYNTTNIVHTLTHKMQSLDLNALSTDLKICVTENGCSLQNAKDYTRWRRVSEWLWVWIISVNTREKTPANLLKVIKKFTYIKIE